MRIATLLSFAALALAAPFQKRQSCTNPSVRKEWRSLTQDQRNQFHQAVKCLQTKPSDIDGQTLFDRFSSLHVGKAGEIHYVARFLPWHRFYLKAREMALNQCGYTGPFPYWDWTIDADANNLSGSVIFDPVAGFGGNGAQRASPGVGKYCVTDGPYGIQSNFSVAYPQTRCLQRNFNMGGRWRMQGSQHTSQVINNILQSDRYSNFEQQLEEGPHDAVHNEVAADMAAFFSPADSLFFAHHCNVDRIWALWQNQSQDHLQDYNGNTVQGQDPNDSSRYPLATLDDTISLLGLMGLPDVTVRDLMDTRSELLCYVYDN